jgi:hypothetical protein
VAGKYHKEISMPRHTNISTLEYALMIIVAIAGVCVLVAALSPILGLIIDGIKLTSALLNGDANAIGSLLPAAK